MHTDTYTVEGMTCGSCIAEVIELVRALPGVSGVAVGYSSDGASPMILHSGRVVPAEDVSAALETRGFNVSGASRRHAQHLMRRFQVVR